MCRAAKIGLVWASSWSFHPLCPASLSGLSESGHFCKTLVLQDMFGQHFVWPTILYVIWHYLPTNVPNHNFPQPCMQFSGVIFLDMSNFPFQWACEGSGAVTLLLEKPSEEQRGWSGVSLWQQGVSGRRPRCPLLVITWNRAALKSCRCWPSPWPETHADVNSLRKRDGARRMCWGTDLITGEISLAAKIAVLHWENEDGLLSALRAFCGDDGGNNMVR